MGRLTTIRDGALEATVDSQGAQLMSLALEGREYLWQGDPAWWSRRAPVLFPTVGVLAGDEATSAQGPVRLKRHGIVRLYDHEVVAEGPSSVTYRLGSSPETREAYPFDFRLEMTYSLAAGALSQRFRVTNVGSVDLPFSLGGHPAFNVPVSGAGDAFEDYELRFERAWTCASPAIDADGLYDFSRMLPVVEDADVLPMSHALFERHLTITLADVPGSRVTLAGPAGRGVEVVFEGFPYLGVWSAEGGAPFVAIEPWCGLASAHDEDGSLEGKRGIVTLEPGGTFERTFSVRPF